MSINYGQSDFMTTNAGIPQDNIRVSQTVGPHGPTLVQDFSLIERLQVQNRERIPERVVHARGITAKGEFTVTNDLSDLTIADFLSEKGKVTPCAARLSTVIHGQHSPEYLRDVRGFSVKMYTQQGNFDMVGNIWPVFFIRDGFRFPEMVRALKPNPKTGKQEAWRMLDFFANYPECMHALTFLFDDIGIPKSFRHVNGFSINTYKLINKNNQETFFRWHWESTLGQFGQMDEDALKQHFSGHTYDFIESIAKGEYPRYNLLVQTMTRSQFPKDFDPLDATKEWPIDRFPLRKVGQMVLNENVNSLFTENEQIAFAPSRMVPGIAPSDDKLLQARLFAYADTQTYRLGINNQMLPINAPKCPFRDNHVDGLMHSKSSSGATREINYFPSVLQSNVVESPPFPHGEEQLSGNIVRQDPRQYDDFIQAGNRWRSFDIARRQRFADRVSFTLASEVISEKLRQIWLNYWYQVDPKLNEMIVANLALLRGEIKSDISPEIKERYEYLVKFREAFDNTSASTR